MAHSRDGRWNKPTSTAYEAQTTPTMSARHPSDDVISISSSSGCDSDCRIVKVLPSPVKRGKNRSTRWKRKPSNIQTKREATLTDQRGREMRIRQREQAYDRDRLGTRSASRVHAKWLNEDSMQRRRDAVCDGGLQGTKRMILKDGHLSVTGEDSQAGHQNTVDSKLSSASSPFSSQGVECKLEVRHQGDDDNWAVRSRSCSTATLDFSPRIRAAQLEGHKELGRDGQELLSMLNGPSEVLDFGPTPRSSILEHGEGEVASSSSAYPMPSAGSTSILKEESNADGARLTRKRRSRHKSRANDDQSGSTGGPQHRIGAWVAAQRDRHQLPPIRSGPMWESIINVGAFSALPGPFFTRPKRVLREVTYEGAMKERAKRKRKRGFNV